jgi:hypothetical protein
MGAHLRNWLKKVPPFWAASDIHATSEIDTAIACQLEEIGG